MSHRLATASLLLAVTFCATLTFTPVRFLAVTTDAHTLVCVRVAPGSIVTLAFTHSMYGGDVTERFQIGRDNNLVRVSMHTDNAAAAEYYAWTGEVRRVGDRFEVTAPAESFRVLPVRVDQIGKHRLTVGMTTWNLASMVEGSAPIRIRVSTRPLLTQLVATRC